MAPAMEKGDVSLLDDCPQCPVLIYGRCLSYEQAVQLWDDLGTVLGMMEAAAEDIGEEAERWKRYASPPGIWYRSPSAICASPPTARAPGSRTRRMNDDGHRPQP